jgi:hypothetical protein
LVEMLVFCISAPWFFLCKSCCSVSANDILFPTPTIIYGSSSSLIAHWWFDSRGSYVLIFQPELCKQKAPRKIYATPRKVIVPCRMTSTPLFCSIRVALQSPMPPVRLLFVAWQS